jgi:hypothetical protein
MSIIINLILAGALSLLVLGPRIVHILQKRRKLKEQEFQVRIEGIVHTYLQNLVKEDK